MPERDASLLIEDMPAAIRKIERYTAGADQATQLAGLRDRIVHDYIGLDLEIIWRVIQHDLPLLKVRLEELARPASSGQ